MAELVEIPIHYVKLDSIEEYPSSYSWLISINIKFMLMQKNLWLINGWITNEIYNDPGNKVSDLYNKAVDIEVKYHFDKCINDTMPGTIKFEDERQIFALSEFSKIINSNMKERGEEPVPINYDEYEASAKTGEYLLKVPKHVVEEWNKNKHIKFMFPILNGENLNFIAISEDLDEELNIGGTQIDDILKGLFKQ